MNIIFFTFLKICVSYFLKTFILRIKKLSTGVFTGKGPILPESLIDLLDSTDWDLDDEDEDDEYLDYDHIFEDEDEDAE